MTKDIIEKLKEEESTKESTFELLKNSYRTALNTLKETESTFRKAKRNKGIIYRDLQKARKELVKAHKNRVGYISKVRRWTKTHMEKVLQ